MRLKLDENLPESLLPILSALGHDVDNVRLQGLVGHPDVDIWQSAQRTERFFITLAPSVLLPGFASREICHDILCVKRDLKKPRTEAAQPKPEEELVCDVCGRFGAFRFGERALCLDCYEGCGSCCPEFGRDDLWTFPEDGEQRKQTPS